jgi:spore coat polysaccharide biosynthesis protein SpsF (cytidylyltransferase family)
MLERLSYSKRIDRTILATSISTADDPLVAYVRGQGYDIFRGSETNVLERFFLAASEYQPNIIIRLTGDCVLIEASIIDSAIDLFLNSSADYVWVDESFAEGLDAEVFSFRLLKKIISRATLASEFEHVTQYIHNNRHKFKRIPLKNTTDDSAYRIVVDEPEDFEVITRIIKHFQNKFPGEYISFYRIKSYLDANVHIRNINSKIIRNEGLQKSLANDKKVR